MKQAEAVTVICVQEYVTCAASALACSLHLFRGISVLAVSGCLRIAGNVKRRRLLRLQCLLGALVSRRLCIVSNTGQLTDEPAAEVMGIDYCLQS